jgi:hypothetical protein
MQHIRAGMNILYKSIFIDKTFSGGRKDLDVPVTSNKNNHHTIQKHGKISIHLICRILFKDAITYPHVKYTGAFM